MGAQTRDLVSLIARNSAVWVACGLVAGLVLCRLGMSGAEAVQRLRSCRPGALFNERFAEYLHSLAT
jgi:hypothetical protein